MLRTHSKSFDLLSLSFNVLFQWGTNRKWPHVSPESHDGQQGEDADLQGFVLQTVAVLLTAAVLLNFNTRTGVGTRRRRYAAVFPGLPVGGNTAITFYIPCWYHSSVDKWDFELSPLSFNLLRGILLHFTAYISHNTIQQATNKLVETAAEFVTLHSFMFSVSCSLFCCSLITHTAAFADSDVLELWHADKTVMLLLRNAP